MAVIEMNNQEEYVSYEVALLAQELGFNWCCREVYEDDNKEVELISLNYYEGDGSGYTCNFAIQNKKDFVDTEVVCTAPTQALLARWLREIYNLHIHITINQFGYGFMYAVINVAQAVCVINLKGGVKNKFETNEVALESALRDTMLYIKENKISPREH